MTSGRQRPFGPHAPRPVPPDPARSDGDEHPEYGAGYREGYAQGFRDGAAAQPDRKLWAEVEVPWSSIRGEDTIIGDDGAQYHVVRSGAVPGGGGESSPGGWIATLVCGTYREVHELDHDARVRVLVPVALADALIVSRDGLPGSRLIATRADPGGGFDGDLPWRVELGGIPRPAG